MKVTFLTWPAAKKRSFVKMESRGIRYKRSDYQVHVGELPPESAAPRCLFPPRSEFFTCCLLGLLRVCDPDAGPFRETILAKVAIHRQIYRFSKPSQLDE
jgi:hypothetical protein